MDLSAYKAISINGVAMKKILIGGVEAWRRAIVNLVPTSIDTDGSIFNGTGYKDGYRLSSSGGLSSQTYTTTTGFIPCKSTDVIRMGGLSYKTISATYNYLAFYDANFTLLGSINIYKESSTSTGYAQVARGIMGINNGVKPPTEANGITTFDNHYFKSDADKVAYFRINGQWETNSGKGGKDLIITVNEEIR